MTTIKMIKTKKKLPQFLRESEIEPLFNTPIDINSFEDLRDQLILYLLYGTGIRLAELISLKEYMLIYNQELFGSLEKETKNE